MHIECYLRVALGDISHLERTCVCYGGTGSDTRPFREGSRMVLDWLLANKRGQFLP